MLLNEGRQDLLMYHIFSDRDSMGQAAARDAANAMRRLLNEKEEINVIFAAAPSQNEMLEALIREKNIAWERINAFHMDEYVGLPQDAPQAFGNFLRNAIFDRVPFKSVQYIHGNAEDVEAECARYTALLQQYPVDIVCLGIGENGHIAFNDPGVADFDDPRAIKEAELDEVCRMQQVHDGCFAALDLVPRTALTLTIPALTRAQALFCTVPAASKRNAVRATITGPVSEDCPASIMRTHACAHLYCDRDSGADFVKENADV